MKDWNVLIPYTPEHINHYKMYFYESFRLVLGSPSLESPKHGCDIAWCLFITKFDFGNVDMLV